MADGKVGVRQAETPDRYIDNEVVVNDAGETVYRQKTVAPTTDAKLDMVNDLLSGEIDAGNSSTIPLAANGVFTGTGVEVTTFAAIYVSVITDAGSATDGLSIQFSHDGTTWSEANGYTVVANTLKILTPNCSARYFRLVYTNGTQAQTSFSLQTVLKRTPTVSNSHKLSDVLSADSDVQAVKAALTAQQPNGDFVNITANALGRLLFALDSIADDGTAAPAAVNQIGGKDSSGNLQSLQVDTSGAVGLAAGSNIVGFVAPSVSKKAGEAKFFLCDSGMMTTTVTNNNAALTFENPAGSGKNAYIVAVTIETDQAAVWAKFAQSPTMNLPTTVKTAYNAVNLFSTGAYASSMIIKGDPMPSEMDGVTSLVARITSNVSVKVELPPFIMTPGNIFGMTVNLGGAGVGSVAVYYYEEAA